MNMQISPVPRPRQRAATFALFLLTCLGHLADRTGAAGLGELLLHQSGALLNAEFQETGAATDSVFQHKAPGDERFAELAAKLRVDLVEPGRDLYRIMNKVGTKSRAALLQVGRVSRPMLLTYLGLELVGQDELDAWYKQERRLSSEKVAASCRKLFAKRRQVERANGGAERELRRLPEGGPERKFHRAYLVFENNVNLFMLESYLRLCSRLEPRKLAAEIAEHDHLF